MNDIKQTKAKSGSSLAAGIAIGAALGAAAVALKDKKNQDKVKDTVKKVKNWADKTAGNIADKSDSIMQDIDRDLESARKEIKEPKE